MSGHGAGDVVRLAQRLADVTAGRGVEPMPATLTAVSTAVLLLGAPWALTRATLGLLGAGDGVAAPLTRKLWLSNVAVVPYLAGSAAQLLAWTEQPTPEAERALGACYEVLAGVDLPGLVEGAGGDVLGAIYTELIAPADRNARGAFYTPADVAQLIAAMSLPEEGDSVSEPCCGTAGMLVATIRAMRRRGLRPETIRWALGDVDRTALALAAVNMAAHGMVHVRLVPGNALAD